ncbi:MAG: type IV pilin protein [Candidatus Binatia bacterium]
MVRLRTEKGFTLIELLVVIAIIGILAAIAIPQFASYRRQSFDADAKSNARNAATAQEAYFVDQNKYTSSLADLTARGYKQSSNINITPTGTSTTFIMSAGVKSGCASGGTWSFASSTGLLTGTKCQ